MTAPFDILALAMSPRVKGNSDLLLESFLAGAEEAGIPCIAFKYSENSGQFQQFREQAGTFSDSIKLWGGA